MTPEHNKAHAPASSSKESSQGSVAGDKRGNIYTLHAREGVNAAELINSALKRRVVGTSVPRNVQVIAPSGPSTSGGKRARQSITLAALTENVPALMLGYLDVAQKRAELRTYDHLVKAHKARFRAPLDITQQDFELLLKELAGMLGTLGFAIGQDDEPDLDRYSVRPRGPSGRLMIVALSVVAAAAVAGAILMR